jgi:glutaminyl-peptide cyclotransferase
VSGSPVNNLNELEYINGFIYANQWQTPYILKINPNTGQVVGRLDLSTLINEVNTLRPGHDYLNGIAYNPDTGTVLVTGKRWPLLYEIKF